MAKYCDRIVVMSGGRVFMDGSRDEVFEDTERLRSAGLDIPQITSLMLLLREKGIDVDGGIYTIEGAMSRLLPLLENRSKGDIQ